MQEHLLLEDQVQPVVDRLKLILIPVTMCLPIYEQLQTPHPRTLKQVPEINTPSNIPLLLVAVGGHSAPANCPTGTMVATRSIIMVVNLRVIFILSISLVSCHASNVG